MANKSEIKLFLKGTGYTKEDMQRFWDECKETNSTIRVFDKNGVTWDQMDMYVIKNLPTQKERDLKYIQEQKDKERLELERKEKEKRDREYYLEHFEEIMVNKIDNKENLTEKELRNVVFDYEIETEYGENRRWTRSVSTVVKLCNRFFMIEWEEGLTEYQPNEYLEQPYEVEKKEYEKLIKVVQWVKK